MLGQKKVNAKSVYGKDYYDYQINRGGVRKMVRRLYLSHLLKLVVGRSVDFGCGAGELLRRLPRGSIGLDINKHIVEYCQSNGLEVSQYDPDQDRYRFRNLKKGCFKTFIMSHVLEHIMEADKVLRAVALAGERLGWQRIIIVVPGRRGFDSDETHKVFIDRDYLLRKRLDRIGVYEIKIAKYFPLNIKNAGNYFCHNELVVVYERKN